MKKLGVVAVIVIALSSMNAVADTRKDKISELLEITGAFDMAQQVHQTLIAQLSPMFPKEAQPILKKVAESLNENDFREMMIEINNKHYTEKEIDEMLRFYKSPEGRSIIKKMPIVMNESMQLGAMYGQMQAKKLIQEMKNAGYEANPI